MKILIVDIDDTFMSYLKMVLEEEGYKTRCAGSGDSAIAIASHEDFDAFILDPKLAQNDSGGSPALLLDFLKEQYKNPPPCLLHYSEATELTLATSAHDIQYPFATNMYYKEDDATKYVLEWLASIEK